MGRKNAPASWPYGPFDATYVKVPKGGRIVTRAIIIEVPVNEDGKLEVLGSGAGFFKTGTFWTHFLRSLAHRGRRRVQLVTCSPETSSL